MSGRFSLMRDSGVFSLWSITHTIFGAFFFIILDKYFRLSPAVATVILLILHTVYEWKDYHVTHTIYENNPGKVKAAHDFVYANPLTFRRWSKPGLGPESHLPPTSVPNSVGDTLAYMAEFHLPPNSVPNSLGDTLAYMVGIGLAYHFRQDTTPAILDVAVWVSIIYWTVILAIYLYVLLMGLHDKKYVDQLYRKSLGY
jgi:hypothetical protein